MWGPSFLVKIPFLTAFTRWQVVAAGKSALTESKFCLVSINISSECNELEINCGLFCCYETYF